MRSVGSASVGPVAGILITLLVVWIVLALLGIVIKGIFWLFGIAVILFIVTLIGYLLRYIRNRA
jgi:hypothetical protein